MAIQSSEEPGLWTARKGKFGSILNNEYLMVPCSAYIWQSFPPVTLFINPSSKYKNKRSRLDWLLNPLHKPLHSQANFMKLDHFFSSFLIWLRNWYVASSPMQWEFHSSYWDCIYSLTHINACPYTQTYTDAYHILSYPGRRNVARFFSFLLLEKLIYSSLLCDQYATGKKTVKKINPSRYLGNQSFPHCNSSLEWRDFLGVGEKLASLPKSLGDKGHRFWYFSPKHKEVEPAKRK